MAIDATGTPTSLGIPTLNTATDAPSGKGINAMMASIDTLLVSMPGKPAGIIAGETIVFNGGTFDRSSVTKIASGSFAGIKNIDVDAAAAIAQSKLAFDGWASYTPTWGATSGVSPVLGNGSLAGSYAQIGKIVHFAIILTMGTSTTYGTGAWTLTVPVTAAGSPMIGAATYVDQSAGIRHMGLHLLNTATQVVLSTLAIPAQFVSAAVPFTWASTDVLQLSGTYQAA